MVHVFNFEIGLEKSVREIRTAIKSPGLIAATCCQDSSLVLVVPSEEKGKLGEVDIVTV